MTARDTTRLFQSKRSRPGSLEYAALLSCYIDGAVNASDLGGGSSSYSALSRLARSGELSKDGDGLHDKYVLTQRGRFTALTAILEVSFTSLCIMAEVYNMHKLQLKNGCRLKYSLLEMDRLLHGVRTELQIRQAVWNLTQAGFTFSVSDHLMALEPKTMDLLRGHDAVLSEMHEWLHRVPWKATIESLEGG